MKRAVVFVLLSAFFAASAYCDDETTTLIYPMKAAETELDDSTPAKRATPPVRESEEYDPVTPIGQIRGVLEDLQTVKTQNAAIVDALSRIQTTDNKELLGLLERAGKDREKIETNVDAILSSSQSIVSKIDALQKTTADLRASLEAVQKTAASVERIRTSRWTDYAVGAILALVLIQLVWKVGSVVVDGIKRRAAQYQEFAAFIREKQQSENTQK